MGRALPWALGALAVLSLVAGLALRRLYPPLHAVASLGPDGAHPLWHVSRSTDASVLTVQALQAVPGDAQHAYELWALPHGRALRVSLGIMPRLGQIERQLTPLQRAALEGAGRLEVSLEPLGGSRSGQATGPSVCVAEVVDAR
jgi:anti-sigma-K factor RskA